MVLKYYFDLASQPARAAWIYLKASGIDFEECKVDLFKGEHKKPEFAAVNPLGYVPAIDDGGFIMRECIAILQYVHAKYNGEDHWYPRDVQKRARIDEYMCWHHTGTRQAGVQFFVGKVLSPMFMGKEVNAEDVEEKRKKLDDLLDKLETVWLKDTQFLNSDELSFADLLAHCELMQPYLGAGYDVYEGRPHLTAWYARVRSALEPHLSEAEVSIRAIGEKYKAL